MSLYRLDFTVSAIVVFVLWLWSRSKSYRRTQGLPLPPGPKGLPIIGNVFDMPKDTEMEWLTIADWKTKYGDIIYVENFGSPLIFLNSFQAVTDLLDERSLIYSDRPDFPMLCGIMGWGWIVPFLPYGERLRKHRQYLYRFFLPTRAMEYKGVQTRETFQFLASLLDSPSDFIQHLRRTTGAIMMMIAYGHEAPELAVALEGDPFISLAEDGVSSIAVAGKPGAFLVDVLPWLRHVPAWFPGARFKRFGNEAYKLSQGTLWRPYRMTKERIRNGSAKSSIVSQLLETNTDEHGQVSDEDIIAGTAGIIYLAGFETTTSALLSFILAMVLFPEVQKNAQEEIDRVVGKDRLPTFEDRDSLPYVEGILCEALRWNPALPLLIPHCLLEDDVYNGYFIPAGTVVIANQWALLHDEDEYPDPMAFQPERWLPKAGQEIPRHPDKGAFGFGRRICPGRYLAQQSIYIAIVSILFTFNINKALDVNGKPIIPTGEYTSGLGSHPKPFECSITPRSPEATSLIRQALENEP